MYTVIQEYGTFDRDLFTMLLNHTDLLTPVYAEIPAAWNIKKLGHVLAKNGELDWLSQLPVFELTSDK